MFITICTVKKKKKEEILQVTWMKEGRPTCSSIIEGILIWNINQFRSKDRPQKCHWIFRVKKKKSWVELKSHSIWTSLYFSLHMFLNWWFSALLERWLWITLLLSSYKRFEMETWKLSFQIHETLGLFVCLVLWGI